MAKQPPESLTIRFCRECGRTDRVTILKDRHYSGGKLCPGVPVKLAYYKPAALTTEEDSSK